MYIVRYGYQYAIGDSIKEAVEAWEYEHGEAFDPDNFEVYKAEEIKVAVHRKIVEIVKE